MTTLSQIIDDLIAETMRPDMKRQMVGFANQTIRELHFEKNSGMAIGFKSNLVETYLTADNDDGFGYDIPRPQLFQRVEAVWFDSIGRYVRESNPASSMLSDLDSRFSWYRSGHRLVFNGYGGVGSGIRLAYFEYPRRLEFYDQASRPVKWDTTEDIFVYKVEYDGTPELREKALWLSTNWLIYRWQDYVMQGVKAKVYARLQQMDRARLAYAAFKEMVPHIISAETYETQTVFMR